MDRSRLPLSEASPAVLREFAAQLADEYQPVIAARYDNQTGVCAVVEDLDRGPSTRRVIMLNSGFRREGSPTSRLIDPLAAVEKRAVDLDLGPFEEVRNGRKGTYVRAEDGTRIEYNRKGFITRIEKPDGSTVPVGRRMRRFGTVTIAKNLHHAEMRLLEWARLNNCRIVAAAPTRGCCSTCRKSLRTAKSIDFDEAVPQNRTTPRAHSIHMKELRKLRAGLARPSSAPGAGTRFVSQQPIPRQLSAKLRATATTPSGLKLQRLARVLKVAGPAMIALDATTSYAKAADEWNAGARDAAAETLSEFGGRMVGAFVGAEVLGLALGGFGSVVPGLGTTVGGLTGIVIGGVVGAAVGEQQARELCDAIIHWSGDERRPPSSGEDRPAAGDSLRPQQDVVGSPSPAAIEASHAAGPTPVEDLRQAMADCGFSTVEINSVSQSVQGRIAGAADTQPPSVDQALGPLASDLLSSEGLANASPNAMTDYPWPSYTQEGYVSEPVEDWKDLPGLERADFDDQLDSGLQVPPDGEESEAAAPDAVEPDHAMSGQASDEPAARSPDFQVTDPQQDDLRVATAVTGILLDQSLTGSADDGARSAGDEARDTAPVDVPLQPQVAPDASGIASDHPGGHADNAASGDDASHQTVADGSDVVADRPDAAADGSPRAAAGNGDAADAASSDDTSLQQTATDVSGTVLDRPDEADRDDATVTPDAMERVADAGDDDGSPESVAGNDDGAAAVSSDDASQQQASTNVSGVVLDRPHVADRGGTTAMPDAIERVADAGDDDGSPRAAENDEATAVASGDDTSQQQVATGVSGTVLDRLDSTDRGDAAAAPDAMESLTATGDDGAPPGANGDVVNAASSGPDAIDRADPTATPDATSGLREAVSEGEPQGAGHEANSNAAAMADNDASQWQAAADISSVRLDRPEMTDQNGAAAAPDVMERAIETTEEGAASDAGSGPVSGDASDATPDEEASGAQAGSDLADPLPGASDSTDSEATFPSSIEQATGEPKEGQDPSAGPETDGPEGTPFEQSRADPEVPDQMAGDGQDASEGADVMAGDDDQPEEEPAEEQGEDGHDQEEPDVELSVHGVVLDGTEDRDSDAPESPDDGDDTDEQEEQGEAEGGDDEDLSDDADPNDDPEYEDDQGDDLRAADEEGDLDEDEPDDSDWTDDDLSDSGEADHDGRDQDDNADDWSRRDDSPDDDRGQPMDDAHHGGSGGGAHDDDDE